MDPASLFMVYLVAALTVWLLGTAVQPALALVVNVASTLRVGRRVAAIAISLFLVAGLTRPGAASAHVLPPSHRMVQMIGDTGQFDPAIEIVVPDRDVHMVQSGDSLWKIARGILAAEGDTPTGGETSDLWRSIYSLNRQVIGDNPNLIHPGQMLNLPTR